MGISFDEAKKRIASISSKAQDTPEIKKMGLRDSVYLSTQFKSYDGKPFEEIEIPQHPGCRPWSTIICSLLRQQGKDNRSIKGQKGIKKV